MSNRPLLEGVFVEDQVPTLRAKVQELQDQNMLLVTENKRLSGLVAGTHNSTARLRQLLGPLHNALKELFGEMETISGGGDFSPQTERTTSDADARKIAVWQSWKSKLGGVNASFIQGLLEHGTMTAPQLRVVCKCHIQSVYDAATKLKSLGLINKNGGKYSLKEL